MSGCAWGSDDAFTGCCKSPAAAPPRWTNSQNLFTRFNNYNATKRVGDTAHYPMPQGRSAQNQARLAGWHKERHRIRLGREPNIAEQAGKLRRAERAALAKRSSLRSRPNAPTVGRYNHYSALGAQNAPHFVEHVIKNITVLDRMNQQHPINRIVTERQVNFVRNCDATRTAPGPQCAALGCRHRRKDPFRPLAKRVKIRRRVAEPANDVTHGRWPKPAQRKAQLTPRDRTQPGIIKFLDVDNMWPHESHLYHAQKTWSLVG